MDGKAEMAGNLKAELLDIREGLRMGELTEQQALTRVGEIRERRIGKVLEPQQQRFFDMQAAGKLPIEFARKSEPYRVPLLLTADTLRPF